MKVLWAFHQRDVAKRAQEESVAITWIGELSVHLRAFN